MYIHNSGSALQSIQKIINSEFLEVVSFSYEVMAYLLHFRGRPERTNLRCCAFLECCGSSGTTALPALALDFNVEAITKERFDSFFLPEGGGLTLEHAQKTYGAAL
jgi:hypothetical protein